MLRRLLPILVVVAVAYVVGWLGQGVLVDDPCIGLGEERGSVDYVDRWVPPRTDCRVTGPDGSVQLDAGSAEIFLVLFVSALAAGIVLQIGRVRGARASGDGALGARDARR